jgi:hypothetical protein
MAVNLAGTPGSLTGTADKPNASVKSLFFRQAGR